MAWRFTRLPTTNFAKPAKLSPEEAYREAGGNFEECSARPASGFKLATFALKEGEWKDAAFPLHQTAEPLPLHPADRDGIQPELRPVPLRKPKTPKVAQATPGERAPGVAAAHAILHAQLCVGRRHAPSIQRGEPVRLGVPPAATLGLRLQGVAEPPDRGAYLAVGWGYRPGRSLTVWTGLIPYS